MTKKICVIGHYGYGLNLLNGQTIKTKVITDELRNLYGKENVFTIDTHGGIRNLFKAPFQVFRAFKNAKTVIILPAHNGLKIYAPLVSLFKRLFKERKTHYIVIGGWLPEFIKQHKWLRMFLKNFDAIYVETKMMMKLLVEENFKNIHVMPNCKPLRILSVDELVFNDKKPYRLCTFSRVMKEKGIVEAIEAVKIINKNYGRIIFTLDIYGQIDDKQVEWFEGLKNSFPAYIKYKGVIPYDKSADLLKDYYLMLFPTYYDGEGFAGTIIDSLASGVPVIASDWRYNSEFIEQHVNGLLVKSKDVSSLVDALIYIYDNEDSYKQMKCECLKLSKNYLPENALKVLFNNID